MLIHNPVFNGRAMFNVSTPNYISKFLQGFFGIWKVNLEIDLESQPALLMADLHSSIGGVTLKYIMRFINLHNV